MATVLACNGFVIGPLVARASWEPTSQNPDVGTQIPEGMADVGHPVLGEVEMWATRHLLQFGATSSALCLFGGKGFFWASLRTQALLQFFHAGL